MDASPKKPRSGREFLVVYGPPCSGKTLNAQQIKEVLGYDHAFDAGFDCAEISQAKGRIILFSHEERVRHPDHMGRPYRYVLRKKPIEAVKRFLGPRWIEPIPTVPVK